jgi:hypothetical protein
VDVLLSKHIFVRAQYRVFVYKTADCVLTSLKVDMYIHSTVLSAGPGSYVLKRPTFSLFQPL